MQTIDTFLTFLADIWPEFHPSPPPTWCEYMYFILSLKSGNPIAYALM